MPTDPDLLTVLAVALYEVDGIEAGIGVLPIQNQHPMLLAQRALTISGLSGGRLLLGLGMTHQAVTEGMWGIPWDKPVRRLNEYLDGLLPLLDGDKVNAAGETVTTRGALALPAAPAPPVYIAALGPKLLQIAGRRSAGTVTWMTGPKTLADHVSPTLRQAAADAGRADAVRVVAALPVSVTDDVDGARKLAAEQFAMWKSVTGIQMAPFPALGGDARFRQLGRDFLPRLTYPLRVGSHFNIAFALWHARGWAVGRDPALVALIDARARHWFGADADCQAWEPGGDEFLSGALCEALLMSAVLGADFADWFERFLPRAADRQPASLFTPAEVSDRSDGKIAHLDGLNLSRAWCWRALARALGAAHRVAGPAEAAARAHLAASLPHVAGNYMGEHWLATFALLALEHGGGG